MLKLRKVYSSFKKRTIKILWKYIIYHFINMYV
jgi:hypothetical protein